MVEYYTEKSIYEIIEGDCFRNDKILDGYISAGGLPHGERRREKIPTEKGLAYKLFVRETPVEGDSLIFLLEEDEGEGWGRINSDSIYITLDYITSKHAQEERWYKRSSPIKKIKSKKRTEDSFPLPYPHAV